MLLILAIFLAVMAAISGAYGFTRFSATLGGVARVLFLVFLVGAIVAFVVELA